MSDLSVEYLPLAELLPYARNMNDHSDGHIAEIAASIKEFGWTVPVLIDKENVLVAGHGRVLAARKLGLEQVPCIRRDQWTETQVKAYRIADNRLPKNADIDVGMLTLELQDLGAEGFDLDLLGFDADELASLLNPEVDPEEGLTDPDAVPENVETRCKPGDLWVLGSHRLLCGDSTNVQHVERLMGGEKADLVVTDPPYNVEYVGKTKDALTIDNDSMEAGDFRAFLEATFASVLVAARPGAPVYVFGPLEDGAFLNAFLGSGLRLQSVLVWLKNALVLGRKDYHYKHEPILYGWVEGAAHEWFGERDKSTVIECQKPPRNGEHPTMKPVELVGTLIKNSSRPNAPVLDLFGGSGTTLLACERTGRRCRMMELDPKYADVILARWEQYTGQTAILQPAEGAVEP